MRRPSARPSRPLDRANVSRAGPRITGRELECGETREPLYSGAIHYWRLSPEAWPRCLDEIKNLGLNIVETYCPWGVHEVGPGEFDFGERDPRKNLGGFLDLVHERGLRAIVRPGPHINAEMTYFGLPERIVYDGGCQARSPRQNPVIQPFPPRMFPVPSYASSAYHAEVGRWYDAVGGVLAPRTWPAGPIVLVQIDNEAAYYFRSGSYDQDYHPDAVSLYRTFLERRHGELADVAAAHRRDYPTWDDVRPPDRFDAATPDELPRHLDWAAFQEELITHSLGRFARRLGRAGLEGMPLSHNIPLGDGGLPMSIPAIAKVVDLVGLDYYHPAREHRAIKRRTLYLAGTAGMAYAPELGVGAPPWFTPLSHEDSMFCALAALAYGLRGFNLYMTVDRDRWYGAPIDEDGTPRVEAGAWKHLLARLRELRFHTLERHVEVGLMVPREYGRLSRVTHLLGGLVSGGNLEAVGGTPVDACREDSLGFKGPVQVLWWRMLGKLADALTEAGLPYVFVDSEAPAVKFRSLRVVVTPAYEFASVARWKRLAQLAHDGVHVVHGPAMPTLDEQMRPHPFELPAGGHQVMVDTPSDARALVEELVARIGLATPCRVVPAPVEATVHEDENGPRVLFVINPERETIDASVDVGGPTSIRDVMTGEELRGTATLGVTLPPRTVRMFEIVAGGQTAGSRMRANAGAAGGVSA